MLYWSLTFLFVALSVGLLGFGIIAFTAAGARKILTAPYSHSRWDSATYIPTWFRRMRVSALAAARHWQRRVLKLVICTTTIIVALVSIGFYHVYFDRSDLPEIEAFAQFEFPTIGTVYDADGRPLIELAKEYRKITKYEDIPPIVRNAILAAEDKHFFSHSGVDYSVIPRVLSKVRMRALAAHFLGLGQQDEALFPQGGSTLTQQLVRGYFLKNLTTKENSNQLLYAGIFPSSLSSLVGARTVNMLVR